MNNSIAINMIKSYSCSTQTPNNIYLGLTLIPKVQGVCDDDHINIGTTSNTHRHFTLNQSLFILQLPFQVANFSNRISIKYSGATINTSKAHINKLYIKYTLCSLFHLSYPPNIQGISASSDHFLCSRSTQFQALVQLWVSSRE